MAGRRSPRPVCSNTRRASSPSGQRLGVCPLACSSEPQSAQRTGTGLRLPRLEPSGPGADRWWASHFERRWHEAPGAPQGVCTRRTALPETGRWLEQSGLPRSLGLCRAPGHARAGRRRSVAAPGRRSSSLPATSPAVTPRPSRRRHALTSPSRGSGSAECRSRPSARAGACWRGRRPARSRSALAAQSRRTSSPEDYQKVNAPLMGMRMD